MLKIADSAAIRHHIPTRPRNSCARGISDCGRATVVAAIRASPYSYFQSGSSGCFKSHSGRRLRTTGIFAKLYSGGGEVVAHSSVQASQGSLPAGFPLKYDQTEFTTQNRMPAIWKTTPTVTIMFQSSQPRPGS